MMVDLTENMVLCAQLIEDRPQGQIVHQIKGSLCERLNPLSQGCFQRTLPRPPDAKATRPHLLLTQVNVRQTELRTIQNDLHVFTAVIDRVNGMSISCRWSRWV